MAIAAGAAKGIDVWDINAEERELVPSDTFLPTSTEDGKLNDCLYSNQKIVNIPRKIYF